MSYFQVLQGDPQGRLGVCYNMPKYPPNARDQSGIKCVDADECEVEPDDDTPTAVPIPVEASKGPSAQVCKGTLPPFALRAINTQVTTCQAKVAAQLKEAMEQFYLLSERACKAVANAVEAVDTAEKAKKLADLTLTSMHREYAVEKERITQHAIYNAALSARERDHAQFIFNSAQKQHQELTDIMEAMHYNEVDNGAIIDEGTELDIEDCDNKDKDNNTGCNAS
ncbi:hypothetical protein BDQ17DRAFT_1436497 [Cyathus striatus]|nr:hypothetical protein BDQ17DRAFT_1436497 [Cyathus striatus]